jgi:hypothetical protein
MHCMAVYELFSEHGTILGMHFPKSFFFAE